MSRRRPYPTDFCPYQRHSRWRGAAYQDVNLCRDTTPPNGQEQCWAEELLDSSLGLVGRPRAPARGPDARGCRAWLREATPSQSQEEMLSWQSFGYRCGTTSSLRGVGWGDWRRRCLSLEKQKEGRGRCPGVLRPSQGHVGQLPPKGVPLGVHTDSPIPARGEHSGSYRTASCGATGSSGYPNPAWPYSHTCGRTDLSLTSTHHQGVLPTSSSALQLPNTPYFHGDAPGLCRPSLSVFVHPRVRPGGPAGRACEVTASRSLNTRTARGHLTTRQGFPPGYHKPRWLQGPHFLLWRTRQAGATAGALKPV